MTLWHVLITIILMLITNITILLPLIIFPTADYLDWGTRTGGTGERQASNALIQGLRVAVAVKDHNLFHCRYHQINTEALIQGFRVAVVITKIILVLIIIIIITTSTPRLSFFFSFSSSPWSLSFSFQWRTQQWSSRKAPIKGFQFVLICHCYSTIPILTFIIITV